MKTKEQPADGLTKPLAKSLFVINRDLIGLNQGLEDDDEGQTLSHSYSDLKSFLAKSLMFTVFLFFMLVGGANGQSSPQSGAVLWRKTGVPVAHGFHDVHLTVVLMSPCKVLIDGNSTDPTLSLAEGKGQKIYEELFLDEIEEMCPVKGWTGLGNRIKRQSTVLFAISIVVSLFSAGLGLAGMASSALQKHHIHDLQAASKHMDHQIKNMERRLRADEESIDRLRTDLLKVVSQLDTQGKTWEDFKNQTVLYVFAISYITGRLVAGNSVIKKANRGWKNGRMTGDLLDYLEVKLNCNDTCPVEYSQPRDCYLTKELDKLFMNFIVPRVHPGLSVVEADPFELYKLKANETCTYSYNGPSNAILSSGENCVYDMDVKPRGRQGVVIAPISGCKVRINRGNETNFRVKECRARKPDDYVKAVQIKAFDGKFWIYCPGSNYSVKGRPMEPCPTEVFAIPLSTSFKINDHEYHGGTLNLNQREDPDPMFTVTTDMNLKPNVNWEEFVPEILMDESRAMAREDMVRYAEAVEEPLQTHWIITYTALSVLGLMAIGAIGVSCVFHCMKKRLAMDMTATVIHSEGRTNDLEMTEKERRNLAGKHSSSSSKGGKVGAGGAGGNDIDQEQESSENEGD